jgi:ectoine hydroxylase-related dioxygenase (phytanoyl-CoA dioxygenase family)
MTIKTALMPFTTTANPIILPKKSSNMNTLRTHPLTDSELKQYQDKGYVTLGRIMDDATLEAIRAEELRFRGNDSVGTIFRNQVSHYSADVRRFVTTGPHLSFAQQLVGSKNLAFWFNQFVTKLPDAGSGKSEFPWHQDNGYVSIEPATNVTIWVALDDVDERNGCVWVLPESHKKGLLDHRTKSTESWHLTLDVEGDGVPAILRAGEAVAFTGLTLHRSKLNHTDKVRRAFFMEYADVESTFQRAGEERQPILKESNTWVVAGQAKWPSA